MNPEEETIRKYYNELPAKILQIRKKLGHPLTLSEKILYSHIFDQSSKNRYLRGIDYSGFAPDRVAMQDATAQMALLQFMMAGKDSSAVPASVHCDHLIIARSGAARDLKSAVKTNKEVYDFLSSVSDKYGIDFWYPGSGIIHQIVFEKYAFPGGMMIGTDSHTPTAGGLGMIAIGVGGADAVDVMAGMEWELKFPKIIGIKLIGRLSGWVSAKDVILKIAGMLSVKGGTGSIIEYFGEGAESISATGKATICNMGAETGATCSVFGLDDAMVKFLVATGRKSIAELAVEVKEHLVMDPEITSDPSNYFDNYLEINLSELEPYINGPFTPDLATPVSKMKEEVKKNGWPETVSAGLIGSCTNSSYEDISRAAAVVKYALENKVMAKSEFKITPGSEQIRRIAERDGFLELFREIGGEVFANACGPCIGQWNRKGAEDKPVNTVIHSFNRNFSKRTDGNPNTYAFVASPEIVAAIAIAGNLTFNPLTDSLVNADGKKVNLVEPRGFDIPPKGFGKPAEARKKTPGKKVPGKNNAGEIAIDPGSERLQLLKPFPEWDGRDFFGMPLLIKAIGKCTTDHISMAGKWLKYRGHLENISKNYMTGAVNFFNDKADYVFNQVSKKYDKVPSTAEGYKKKGTGSVVAGEENFGEGSSREHAAMEPRFLNVKVIIVKSFARIHETNLKKQGILTLTFADKNDYNKIREDDKFDITGLQEFLPGKQLTVVLNHSDGSKEKIVANHSYNNKQIEWFKAGSALNLIRKGKINKNS
ncbi:MAG: aconitate hydratase [Bacteroidales bacterium]|jgi:aconitate hydratase|nr:aconitate hydratase [Bacteroidales bacterium]